MQCPKCNAPFQKATFADGVADRCTNCLGIWLDDQEHELLKGIATSVDIGNSRKGARFNKIDQISCPVCPDTPLLRLVDPDQPHIWFESCPSCKGRFYDAGEYRDYSTRTIGDFIKGLSAKPRN